MQLLDQSACMHMHTMPMAMHQASWSTVLEGVGCK